MFINRILISNAFGCNEARKVLEQIRQTVYLRLRIIYRLRTWCVFVELLTMDESDMPLVFNRWRADSVIL